MNHDDYKEFFLIDPYVDFYDFDCDGEMSDIEFSVGVTMAIERAKREYESRYGWRRCCEDGSEFGIDPDNYETESEYDLALEEAKYSWRDSCEDGWDFGVYPEDYETEEEYNAALAEGKYRWREDCEDGSEFDIDPDDYETESEYDLALEAAKYGWRDSCEDGWDLGVHPVDYETEDEYDEALMQAKQRRGVFCGADEGFCAFAGSDAVFKVEEMAPAPAVVSPVYDESKRAWLKEPQEKDFSTKRGYQAAQYMYVIDQFDPAERRSEEHRRYEFILTGKNLAARYLTAAGGLLVAQATKAHFSLPCTFPGEDEYPRTEPDELISRVARRDAKLAIEIWDWWIKEFGPYVRYLSNPASVYNQVMYGLFRYQGGFITELISYIEQHKAFALAVYRDNPEVPVHTAGVACAALKQGKVDVALAVFTAFLCNRKVTPADIEELVDSCILGCRDGETLEAMELFRDQLYPCIKRINDPEITMLFTQWENDMEEYISYIERTEERYAYCRHFAWRAKYRDEDENLLCYDSEEEYLEALEEEKHGWKRRRRGDAERYQVPIDDYETESEFQDALVRAVQFARANERKSAERQWQTDPLAETDKTAYGFCHVVFGNSMKTYAYKTGDIAVEVGDQVIVPVGGNRREAVATVVSVGRYMRVAAPYPVDLASEIIRKVE